MRNEYDSLARALAMAEAPEERAAVGAALAAYYARRGPRDAAAAVRLAILARALRALSGGYR